MMKVLSDEPTLTSCSSNASRTTLPVMDSSRPSRSSIRLIIISLRTMWGQAKGQPGHPDKSVSRAGSAGSAVEEPFDDLAGAPGSAPVLVPQAGRRRPHAAGQDGQPVTGSGQ